MLACAKFLLCICWYCSFSFTFPATRGTQMIESQMKAPAKGLLYAEHCVCTQSVQLFETLRCSPPGSSVHELFPSKNELLFPTPGDLSNPGIEPCVSCIGRWILDHWATWEAHRHWQIIGKLRRAHCGLECILGGTLHLLCTLVSTVRYHFLPSRDSDSSSLMQLGQYILTFELRGFLYWFSSSIWWQVTNNDPRHTFH